MKKLRAWFDRLSEPQIYWLLQTTNAATVAMMAFSAAAAEPRWLALLDAGLAGFFAALVLFRVHHRRLYQLIKTGSEIIDQQQALMMQIMNEKAAEIAAELASRMDGNISITGPDGETIYPKPTKH